jgi:hypothetical protein
LAPLCAIVCGFEKSGTTLLNEILRRHPALDSGHEVGVLLGASPREFSKHQPYFSFFRNSWRLSGEQAQFICDTNDWGTFYRRTRDVSPLITDKTVSLFDKTPIYMRYLDQILEKAAGIPCVVNVRDPRALMHSWANWSGHSTDPARWLEENFAANCDRFLNYARGYKRACMSYGDQLLLNRFEELCMNPIPVLERIFGFLGLEFSEEYLTFDSEHFVYGNTVSRDYIFAYRNSFNADLSARILDATMEFEDWHHHG